MKSLLNMLYDYAIDSSIIKYNVSRNVRNISYKKFAQPKKKTAEEQIFMGKEETSVIELAMKQYKNKKKCRVSGNWFEFYVRITCWRTCCVEKEDFSEKVVHIQRQEVKSIYMMSLGR